MLFEFKIVDKEIFNTSKKEVIKDKKHRCKFYFDEETYKNKELFVTFINKFGYSRTIMLGRWKKTLLCDVPPRMLEFDYFKIFCYTKSILKTKTIKVYNQVALDKVEQTINKIDGKIDNILYENGELKCYANNILINTIPLGHVDEVIVSRMIDDRLVGIERQINEHLEECITEEDVNYLISNLL